MTIPQVVDGVTDADAAFMNQLVDAANQANAAFNGAGQITTAAITPALGEYEPLVNMRAGVANVLDYGAAGDDSTDDLGAFQGGIDDLAETGGGTLLIPGNRTYRFSSSPGTYGGMIQQLTIACDDITLQFEPGAVIRSNVVGARVIFASGSNKPNGAASWDTNDYLSATGYDLSGTFARGTYSITLDTAVDAANFAAGDDIWIRTGQTLISGTGQPLAELNLVTSVDADTGVITLRYPLSHTYQQEYFITGTGGYTSTDVTANPALFQCANVTDRTLRRLKLINPTIEQSYDGTTFGQVLSLWEGCDFDVISPTLRYCSNGLGSRNTRHVRVLDWKSEHTAGRNDEYAIGPSTGCTFWTVPDFKITSTAEHYLHIHEGVGNSDFGPGSISGQEVNRNLIDISSRSGGALRVHDIDIYASMTEDINIVGIDDKCDEGGILSGVHLHPTGHAARFIINSDNWIGLDTCTTENGRVSLRGAQRGFGHETHTRVLSGWVVGLTAAQFLAPALGTLPELAMVLRVTCYVYQAFNSDGTDQIVVGHSGATNAYATAIDVSTTGVKSVTLGSEALIPASASTSVIATYTAGGSAPTTGQALVTVEYALVARRD